MSTATGANDNSPVRDGNVGGGSAHREIAPANRDVAVTVEDLTGQAAETDHRDHDPRSSQEKRMEWVTSSSASTLKVVMQLISTQRPVKKQSDAEVPSARTVGTWNDPFLTRRDRVQLANCPNSSSAGPRT
jgi:hypothetical protein